MTFKDLTLFTSFCQPGPTFYRFNSFQLGTDIQNMTPQEKWQTRTVIIDSGWIFYSQCLVQEIYCPDLGSRIAQGTNSPVGGEKGGVFQLVRGPGGTLKRLHVLETRTLPCSGHYITNGLFLGKNKNLDHKNPDSGTSISCFFFFFPKCKPNKIYGYSYGGECGVGCCSNSNWF